MERRWRENHHRKLLRNLDIYTLVHTKASYSFTSKVRTKSSLDVHTIILHLYTHIRRLTLVTSGFNRMRYLLEGSPSLILLIDHDIREVKEDRGLSGGLGEAEKQYRKGDLKVTIEKVGHPLLHPMI